MKKFIYAIISLFIILLIVLFCFLNRKQDNDITKIKVAEVAHSIFYAPLYAADSLGYFEDEGLDVEIILTSGADSVAAAVMSDDVQIGFCGSEQTIYIYNQGADDYLINFAALTKKDGSFIVSREDEKNFDIKNLKGKYIIAGRTGGMPAMTFEWILNQNGITTDDLTFDTSIAFASMSGAFIGGTGDYVSLFEPTASDIETNGYGYIVASLGELGGNVPYTTFNAKKSYITENKDTIQKFVNAINKGLEFVHSNSSDEVAKAIQDYFPDVSYNNLTKIVQNYMDIDSWYETTLIEEKDFEHIQDIIENAGELDKRVDYDILFDSSFSK